MKRKLTALLLTAVLLCLLCVPAMGAGAAGLANFRAVAGYRAGQFADVGGGAWYASPVAAVCRMGLMNGISKTSFGAEGNITVAQTVTLAVRLHSTYYNGECTVQNGSPWYQPYLDYAALHGLTVRDGAEADRTATRAEFASILGSAFPDAALPAINRIDDGAIPVVPMTADCADAVYRLYRAGILIGSDGAGSFLPDESIRRSEVAAIIARMADVTQRESLTLCAVPESEAVAEQCSPAVFRVESYDRSGAPLESGFGFFIEPSGLAAADYRVLRDGSSASVCLADGSVHAVLGVYDYDEDLGLALIQVEGGDFPALEAEAEPVQAGQTLYAVGSAVAPAIVSDPGQTGGAERVRFAAPVSCESGGAVVTGAGKLVGIFRAAEADGDGGGEPASAIPVSRLSEFGRGAYTPLSMLGGWLYIEDRYDRTVCVGAEEEIPVCFAPSEGFLLRTELLSGADAVSLRWGERQEGGCFPLYVTGLRPGAATVNVELWNAADTVLWDRQSIYIETVKAKLTVSDPNPVLYPGVCTVLTVSAESGGSAASLRAECEAEDAALLSCEWGDGQLGDGLDLCLTGLGSGRTALKLTLYDGLGRVLTELRLPVVIY